MSGRRIEFEVSLLNREAPFTPVCLVRFRQRRIKFKIALGAGIGIELVRAPPVL